MKKKSIKFPDCPYLILFQKRVIHMLGVSTEEITAFLYDRDSKEPVAFGVSARNPIDAPNDKYGRAIAARRALKATEGKHRAYFYGPPIEYGQPFPRYGWDKK